MRKFLTLLCVALAALLPGCHSVELKDNIVTGWVYIPFTTQGDWEVYGVSGALDSRRFIMAKNVPAGYPYQQQCGTGMGGVLLVSTVYGDYRAFDLACPVERSPAVLVAINSDTNMAVCPKCKSVYDVFQLQGGPGYPVEGPALADGCALTPYSVLFNADNRYALISR